MKKNIGSKNTGMDDGGIDERDREEKGEAGDDVLCKTDVNNVEPTERPSEPKTPKRILVIDDEPPVRKLLTSILKNAGELINMIPHTHKKSIMDEIREHLFQKLSDKGLMSNEVARVVKDIFMIFEEKGHVNAPTVNNKLCSLGWQDQLTDEHILNLLVFLFENGPEKTGF